MCYRQDSQVTVQNIKETLEQVEQMDRFQVVSELNRFFVHNIKQDELNLMKLHLKRVLLQEIMKVEVDDRNNYKERLASTVRLLEYKSNLYGCFLIGCRFEGNGHREYVKHIRTSHPQIVNVICNFRHRCVRSFLTIEDLLVHIRKDHSNAPAGDNSAVNTAVLDVPVKCSMSSCGSIHLSSIKLLVTHFNTVHLKDARSCVFAGCGHKFGPFQESRKHFRTKHVDKGHTDVKDHHHLPVPRLPDLPVLSVENPISVGSPEHDEDNDDEHYDAFQIDEIENCEPDDDSEEYFLHYYADFLNRLSHVKFIPHSTVQDIASEYFKNSKRAQDIRETKLRHSLSMVGELSADDIDKVVKDVIHEDFFIKAQGELDTKYKRNRFVQDNFNYVQPLGTAYTA